MKILKEYSPENCKLISQFLKLRQANYFSAIALVFIFLQFVIVSADPTIPQPQVVISGASGEMITFRTQNGKEIAGKKAQSHQIPHLVLQRNGKLTSPRERRITIEISGIQLPTSGAAISLAVSTQHTTQGDDQDNQKRILVWQETRWLSRKSNGSLANNLIRFDKVFEDLIDIKDQQATTPTDYFRVDISVTNREHPLTDPLFKFHQDYAFLLENQWLVDLPEVSGEAPGAAPSELIVYYYDMLPFQSMTGNFRSSMPRDSVTKYLQSDLIPAMQTAFNTESNEWGFSWHLEWRSYRPGEPPNRLGVALTDGLTWYHGRAHARGSGGISLRVDSEDNAAYQNLTDSLMGTFYHELFHNLQRSINLHHGGDGDVDGSQDVWQFFSEGTAVLATSVGQPEVQFSRTPGLPVYFIEANGYLAGGGNVVRDFNKSFHEIDPYHAVLYWRFLYEKCGGMSQGKENPRSGMQIILNALDILYSTETVDIKSSIDLAENLPEVMDLAIHSSINCPFADYQDSLTQFAAAIYSLQLENGRCLEPGLPVGCGMYDPVHSYLQFPIPEFTYTGEIILLDSTQGFQPDGFSNGYGMDFIKINLAHETHRKSLNLELITSGDAYAEFTLQVIKVKDQQGGGIINSTINQVMTNPSHPVINIQVNIIEIDIGAFNQLGIIITRVDNQESSAHPVDYTVKLFP